MTDLQKEDIDRLRFWVKSYGINPKFAAVLLYEDGTEYPILCEAPMVWSADSEWAPAEESRVEPSDDFYDALAEALKAEKEGTREVVESHPEIESYEWGLIGNVVTFKAADNAPFEFEWLIEKAGVEA
jgi:hypothetical protein